jgi:cation diffusion facilitator CzcD-associated flavoprotein CzcO
VSQVLATGFSLSHLNIDIRGRNGKHLKRHWDSFGYKEAFKSVAMHDFPNYFYITGPNSGRAYTSAIFASEKYLS